jgi:hypothetical protein
MRISLPLFVTISLMTMVSSVNAFETDFVVKMKNQNSASDQIVVARVNFSEVGIPSGEGSFGVSYQMIDTLTGTPIFSGSSTIMSNETSVIVGNINVGKITMTYDPLIDQVKTRFAIIAPSAQYDVSASDIDLNWVGRAQISSANPR